MKMTIDGFFVPIALLFMLIGFITVANWVKGKWFKPLCDHRWEQQYDFGSGGYEEWLECVKCGKQEDF